MCWQLTDESDRKVRRQTEDEADELRWLRDFLSGGIEKVAKLHNAPSFVRREVSEHLSRALRVAELAEDEIGL